MTLRSGRLQVLPSLSDKLSIPLPSIDHRLRRLLVWVASGVAANKVEVNPDVVLQLDQMVLGVGR
jgi:hypothetical protein